jgi:hypothetical protein
MAADSRGRSWTVLPARSRFGRRRHTPQSSFTPKGSLVRSQYRPPHTTLSHYAGHDHCPAWCFFEYHLCTRSNLTHLPGQFAANAAWLTLAAITHNLTRAAATLAAPALNSARTATIRTRIINIAARLSSHT